MAQQLKALAALSEDLASQPLSGSHVRQLKTKPVNPAPGDHNPRPTAEDTPTLLVTYKHTDLHRHINRKYTFKKKKQNVGQCQHTPLISTLGRQRQADLSKFEASLVYRGSYKTARAR